MAEHTSVYWEEHCECLLNVMCTNNDIHSNNNWGKPEWASHNSSAVSELYSYVWYIRHPRCAATYSLYSGRMCRFGVDNFKCSTLPINNVCKYKISQCKVCVFLDQSWLLNLFHIVWALLGHHQMANVTPPDNLSSCQEWKWQRSSSNDFWPHTITNRWRDIYSISLLRAPKHKFS